MRIAFFIVAFFLFFKASLLKNLHHKNIVAYVESFKEADLLIIVMEYCERKLQKRLTIMKIEIEKPNY